MSWVAWGAILVVMVAGPVLAWTVIRLPPED
jgi:hypothetical protein